MIAVVNGSRGTARTIKSEKYIFAGKTGSAQVVGHKTTKNMADDQKIQKKLQDHSWFTVFGPVENPEVSVVVLVENGGGSSVAVPIAKKILDYYMENIYSPMNHTYNSTSPLNNNQMTFTARLQAAFL